MDRHDLYRVLVAKRKAHVFPPGLLNPSQIEGGMLDEALRAEGISSHSCLSA